MRQILPALAAACLMPGLAIACDDHTGTCKIEDFAHTYTPELKALQIDGVATCNSGRISLRLYDGEGANRKFLGVETAFIEGHIFQALKLPVEKPRALSVKYSIAPE